MILGLTGFGGRIPAILFPPKAGSDGNSAASFQCLPKLSLVGSLVTQTANAPNRGKKSRKFNQGCTICHSCHWVASGRIGSRKRENRD